MAYSNAVFHLDLYNGNDAARTALTTCIASNPSGTITRITKAGHGLVTGAVVTLSLFTAWLNGAWKITVVDANSFDLDGAVWQTTADANGTVTPFGGSSWADAWKTNNAGVTIARVQAGDKIKVCKTPDQTSIGQATWTHGSRIVTLATPLTKTVDNGVSGWVASANITLSYYTQLRKIGDACLRLSIGLAFTTGKAAYKTLPSQLDLSSYQELCFWFMGYYAYSTNQFSVCLCSDTTGDVVVDTFNIPGSTVTVNSHLTAWNLQRVGGGNLGNNINSIAIYVNVDTGTGSQILQLTNVFATPSGGVNLTTLFGKSGIPQQGEPFYAIFNIDETSVELAEIPDTYSMNIYGYTGTSETTETFIRVPFAVYNLSNQTQVQNTIAEDGLEFEFGWDTITDQLTGETVYSTYNCQSILFQIRTETVFSGFISVHTHYSALTTGTPTERCNIYIRCVSCIRYSVFQNSTYLLQASLITVDYAIYGNYSLVLVGHSNTIVIKYLFAQQSSGLNVQGYYNMVFLTKMDYFTASARAIENTGINTLEIEDSINRQVYCAQGIINVINGNYSTTDPVLIYDGTKYCKAEVRWLNRTGNNEHEVFKFFNESLWQTTEKYMEEVGALETITAYAIVYDTHPAIQDLGEINFNANSLVTITIPIKKTHPVGEITAGIGTYRNPIVGIEADIRTVMEDNTDWQLISIQFTPTQKGVARIYIYYYGGNITTWHKIYTGKIQATQA